MENNETIKFEVGTHVVSIVLRGRDEIFKAAVFNPRTNYVDGLVEIQDKTAYQYQKPDELTIIYSTVVNDLENPLMPNGVIQVQLPKPFWETLEELLGKQLEHLTDLQAINSVNKMLVTLAQNVKEKDPSIAIFEKQNKQIGTMIN